MNSPLHSAANMLNRRRRNAMSVSNSLATDMREGLQMLSASMFPSLTLPPSSAASVAALASSAAPNAMGSSAQETRERLRQRRNALVNINSRALRLALNLPLSPQASPLTSPQRRFVFGRNENNAAPAVGSLNNVGDSFSLDGNVNVIPDSADEQPVLMAPRSPAPPPRARSNLRRRAAICFQTPAQLFASTEQQQASAPSHEEKEDGAAGFLPAIESVEPLYATSPSTSPLAKVFGSPMSASSIASVSSSPPLPSFPPRLSPPMFSRRPSSAMAPGMVPRNNRRRGAVIAHADFMREIPEEWVQMQQQEGQEEDRVSHQSSPRIRRMTMQSISLDDSSFEAGSVEGSPFFSPIDASDNSVTPVEIHRRASLPSLSYSSVGAVFGGLVGSPDSAEVSQYAGSHWSTSAGIPELLGAEVVDGRDDCVLLLGYVAAEQDHHRRQYPMEEPGVEDQKENEYSVSQPGGAMMATQVNYSSACAAHVQR